MAVLPLSMLSESPSGDHQREWNKEERSLKFVLPHKKICLEKIFIDMKNRDFMGRGFTPRIVDFAALKCNSMVVDYFDVY